MAFIQTLKRFLYKTKIMAAKGLLRCIWGSCRVGPIIGEEHLLKLIQSKQPAILCYWHQAHIVGLRYLLQIKKRHDLKLSALSSPSRDGKMAASVLMSWGIHVVSGSSSRTGAQALRDLFYNLKQGYSPIITPDGPRGPIFICKPGAIMLSKITQAPILPITIHVKRAWHLGSWDRCIIPKPFAKARITIGTPILVDKNASTETQEALRLQMEKALGQGNAISSLEQHQA